MATSRSHSDLIQQIHRKAMDISARYKRCEIGLIEILEQIDTHKVFYTLGYGSLFEYAHRALGLSEEVCYIFINVARKAKEVPALKAEIKSGTITVSKAKRITSVLTEENQNHWLELAKCSTKRELEKQVAIASPRLAVRDKLEFVSTTREIPEKAKVLPLPEARVQLQIGISERLMLKIRRVQDLLSQRMQRPVGLEGSLDTLVNLFLERSDPVEKAKRQKIEGKLKMPSIEELGPGPVRKAGAKSTREGKNAVNRSKNHVQKKALVKSPTQMSMKAVIRDKARAPIKAPTKHQLMLRYHGQCAHVDVEGQRCQSRRFLHIHHKTPISNGGTNELNNLELRCAGHHRAHHFMRGR